MKFVSVSQMRELDNKTIYESNIPGPLLMERAGKGLAEQVLNKFKPKKVLVFAGSGNNGGDGIVAARYLAEQGILVRLLIFLCQRELTEDAKVHFFKLKKIRGKVTTDIINKREEFTEIIKEIKVNGEKTVIIDALLGTGARQPVKGLLKEAIEWINSKKGSAIVSVDIPSGMNGDSGLANECVNADLTVTMGLPKHGLIRGTAQNCVGKIEVIQIGIPEELIKEINSNTYLLCRESLPVLSKRPAICHKGSFGHLLIIGGSIGLTGAPTLASLSALRCGAGLVTLGCPESTNPILEVKLTEVMTKPLTESTSGVLGVGALPEILRLVTRKQGLVLGPGLSREKGVMKLVQKIVEKAELPTVLDADAILAFSGKAETLALYNHEIVLTPHPGEMAQLIGTTIEEIQKDRISVAVETAKRTGKVVVLKGAGTVIAEPSGSSYVNSTGNPGMASGGMGDVLAGMIGSFLVQGKNALEAALLGVYLHGKAGDLAVKTTGESALIASDVIKKISQAMKEGCKQ